MSKQKSTHFLSSKAKEIIFKASDAFEKEQTPGSGSFILGQNSKGYGCEPQHSGSSSTGEEGNWHIAVSLEDYGARTIQANR